MLETKKVLEYGNKDYINDLQAFGWQATEVISESSGRSHYYYQILARDTNMINYQTLTLLENQYEKIKEQMEFYEEMEIEIVGLLLLLFIIPGVMYITYKLKQKNRINEDNARRKEQMNALVKKARSV